MKKRNLSVVDIVKLFFAISIVTLHISIKSPILIIYAQFIARLGVPFFFTISGYFLYSGIKKDGEKYLKSYIFRISKLLGIWLLIYLPIIVKSYLSEGGFVFLLRIFFF